MHTRLRTPLGRGDAYNYPGNYIRHNAYELRIDPFADNSTYRADASFTSVDPWA